MLIKTQIELELDKIKIGENPMNKKGKFAEYEFKMISPSEYYFFTKPKIPRDDFSIFWGRSPTVVFYDKNFKPLERQIKSLIMKDLPQGNNWEWEWENVTSWYLSISDYRTPHNDRSWALYYTAEGWWHRPSRTKTVKEGFIELSKDFMSRLKAELPTKFDTGLEIC